MVNPLSYRTTYNYDAAGRITYLVNPQSERTSYAYDEAGRRTLSELANGTRATFICDAADRLARLANVKSDDSVISQFDYGHDDAGNRTYVVESNGDRVTWTYDASNRLTHEVRSGANAFSISHVYDEVGNRLVKIDGAARTTYVYDAANQLATSDDATGTTAYTFDDAGNLQVAVEPSGDRTTNSWDYENQMTLVEHPSGARSTYTYNASNRRVAKETATEAAKFIWDGDNYLMETDAANATQAVFTNEPQKFGLLLSQRRLAASTWTPRYFHFDVLGSTSKLTDSSENVTDTRTYNAYGETVATSGSTTFRFGFVGQLGYYYDSESQRYYVRERSYHSTLARWSSQDPTGLSWGDGKMYRDTLYASYHGEADPGDYFVRNRVRNARLGSWLTRDPISKANLYEYVGGSPLVYADPSGLQQVAAPNEFNCDKSLSTVLERFSDLSSVKHAVKCHVNIYCGDGCNGFAGFTYSARGFVNVCLDKNQIRDEQSMAYIVIHELVHVEQLLNDKSLCQEQDVESCPPISESDTKPIPCKECLVMEERAYQVSCRIFHDGNSTNYRKCIEVGKCISCRHICPVQAEKFADGECVFPAPDRPYP